MTTQKNIMQLLCTMYLYKLLTLGAPYDNTDVTLGLSYLFILVVLLAFNMVQK